MFHDFTTTDVTSMCPKWCADLKNDDHNLVDHLNSSFDGRPAFYDLYRWHIAVLAADDVHQVAGSVEEVLRHELFAFKTVRDVRPDQLKHLVQQIQHDLILRLLSRKLVTVFLHQYTTAASSPIIMT